MVIAEVVTLYAKLGAEPGMAVTTVHCGAAWKGVPNVILHPVDVVPSETDPE
jgi:hypothetical protein